ncbi:MAG: PDZ domain-containing protein [Rhodocyclaceae bacterium]
MKGWAGLCMAVCVLLSGCATNGYKQYYRAEAGSTPDVIARTRAAAPAAEPIVERGPFAPPPAILYAYAKRGYQAIGYSAFTLAERQSDGAAIQQAKDVGADLVLIFIPAAAGSRTTVMPITTPTTSTTYSNGMAIVNTPQGPVTAYGSGQTTTYGSQTNFVPITENFAHFGAIYFVRARVQFGAYFRDLNDAERQRTETNKGAVVQVVVDNSPAFDADVLPGDVVLTVNGEPVTNAAALTTLVSQKAGQQLALSIDRNGKSVDKTIQTLP